MQIKFGSVLALNCEEMMYNFSGIEFKIYTTSGMLLLVGLTVFLMERPWKKGFWKSKYAIFSVITLIMAITSGTDYAARILRPNVDSYTGEFIESRNVSSKAFPFQQEFVFWNGEGKKKVFDLDLFSAKKIIPNELMQGKEYTVYFDEGTKIIVAVQTD